VRLASFDDDVGPIGARPWRLPLPMPPVAPVTTTVLPAMGLMFLRFIIVLVQRRADWCRCNY
jgi:hypothetical protein